MLDHSTQLILKPAQSIEEDPKGFIIEIKGDFQTDKEYKEIVSKVKELWKNFSDSIIID